MAGANIPNGAVDALIMDRCFSSGSMISLLLARQPTRESDRIGAPNAAPSAKASHHSRDWLVLICIKRRAVCPSTANPSWAVSEVI